MEPLFCPLFQTPCDENNTNIEAFVKILIYCYFAWPQSLLTKIKEPWSNGQRSCLAIALKGRFWWTRVRFYLETFFLWNDRNDPNELEFDFRVSVIVRQSAMIEMIVTNSNLILAWAWSWSKKEKRMRGKLSSTTGNIEHRILCSDVELELYGRSGVQLHHG